MINVFCTNPLSAGLLSGMAALAMLGQSAAQAPATTTVTAGPSLIRPEFTRPAGVPAAARRVGAGEFMIAPAQPPEPKKIRRKRK
ncbi:MAG: hypothetical protein H3C55_05410 [Pseudorhodoplanes sp.]|nr:hypothetical protein [Pseudorhodoplanes sp.]MBW7948770.1 hypothetical protein [Pseudorhodoplanes sp.]MCQ3943943.1 hypothetical protein [Alphaproteobacteria bacterium]GIK82412.1 MAG: hypothetical protein BroJett024_35170 [Alphaproteobacteria bacterium]